MRRPRPRIVAATVAAVAGLGAVVWAVTDPGDPGGTPVATTTTARTPTTTTSPGPATTTSVGASSSTATTASGPAAPWRQAPLPGADAPGEFREAWGRAANREECALVLPTDLGPRMVGAVAGFSPTNDDAGWDVVLRKQAAIVQILGLFPVETAEGGTASFSRRWSDGSVARYGPDDPDPSGPSPDPEATANEAVLVIPGQGCAYRIYDTLGKTHLERVLESLRFVEGAP